MTYTNISDQIWGVIPARGGSKSIPYKNLLSLNGNSLIEYQFKAAQASKCVDKIICSTEDKKIEDHCKKLGIEIHKRPIELASDTSNVVDSLLHLLRETANKGKELPLAIALLQPTSPFILPEHIESCVNAIKNTAGVASSQTIAKIPHNYHAYNQREITGNFVQFHFQEERERCYNKQTKPKFYSFGNLIVTKTEALINDLGVFASPSIAVEIPTAHAFDLDCSDDIIIAKNYIESATVKLNHLK